jgi:hypothetical protein
MDEIRSGILTFLAHLSSASSFNLMQDYNFAISVLIETLFGKFLVLKRLKKSMRIDQPPKPHVEGLLLAPLFLSKSEEKTLA